MGAVVNFDPITADQSWQVITGDKDPFFGQFTRALGARLPPQIRIAGSSLEIRRTMVHDLPYDKRRDLLDRWQKTLADKLQSAGYNPIEDYELHSIAGMSWLSLRDRVVAATPEEHRDNYDDQLSLDAYWLTRNSRSCDGGLNMMAGVIAVYGDRGDPHDYGALVVFGSAGSQCQGEVGRLGREQERVIKASIQQTKQEIRRTP